MAPLYLVDTNILVHLLRSTPLGEQLRRTHDLLTLDPLPCVTLVVEAELRSLSLQWNWGSYRQRQLEFLLEYFPRISLENSLFAVAYAAIDALSERVGRPMGKNDVWLAAIAHVTDHTLLTTDRDYDHLHPHLLTRELVQLSPEG